MTPNRAHSPLLEVSASKVISALSTKEVSGQQLSSHRLLADTDGGRRVDPPLFLFSMLEGQQTA